MLLVRVVSVSLLTSFAFVQDYADPTESIDLRVFSSVKSSEDYTNRSHSFDVYSSDMVFSMVAESEAEKEGEESATHKQRDTLRPRENRLKGTSRLFLRRLDSSHRSCNRHQPEPQLAKRAGGRRS